MTPQNRTGQLTKTATKYNLLKAQLQPWSMCARTGQLSESLRHRVMTILMVLRQKRLGSW